MLLSLDLFISPAALSPQHAKTLSATAPCLTCLLAPTHHERVPVLGYPWLGNAPNPNIPKPKAYIREGRGQAKEGFLGLFIFQYISTFTFSFVSNLGFISKKLANNDSILFLASPLIYF